MNEKIEAILKDPTFLLIDAEMTVKELKNVLFLVSAPLEMIVKDMGNNTNPTKEAAKDALELIKSTLA